MTLFLCGLGLLFLGYFTYGTLVEKMLLPDDRKTPAVANPDGVDYVELPCWKNMLIHLLNIAGIGPVIGVIAGIKFGVISFIIIPLGNVIGGATYDFVLGFMSLRNNGANLPELMRKTGGKTFYVIFSIFLTIVLLLVVAVFINVPATLLNGMVPARNFFWVAVVCIFLYYIMATILPIDKIIGRFYPFFGLCLLVASASLLGTIIYQGFRNPAILQETEAFLSGKFTNANNHPILPLLFVTIACGIISGFHATQSPIVARTMRSERQAKRTYYGMMIAEGFIAMIWGAGALAIYNLFPEFLSQAPAVTLSKITDHFLFSGLSSVTVISVVILSITSGDTALRSLRLSLAEAFHYDQKNLAHRFIMTSPLIVIVALLLWWSNASAKSFNILWNCFAWSNQVIAACALTCATSWLIIQKKNPVFTIVPGFFLTYIVATYLFWTSPAHNGPVGFGLELPYASLVGFLIAFVITMWSWSNGQERLANLELDHAKK